MEVQPKVFSYFRAYNKTKRAQKISDCALSERYIKPDLKYISKAEIKLIYSLIRFGIEPLILGLHHDLRDRLIVNSYSQVFLVVCGVTLESGWHVSLGVE